MIKESFPADHPYASHINRTALLPNFDNPSDPQKGPAGDVTSRLPANPAPTIVKKKTFGSDKRHELQQDLMPSERKTVPWVTNYQDYYQVTTNLIISGRQYWNCFFHPVEYVQIVVFTPPPVEASTYRKTVLG